MKTITYHMEGRSQSGGLLPRYVCACVYDYISVIM